jgi:hypothetical protein
VTPEAYIAAVKACPRVAWIHINYRYDLKLLWRGYATGLENSQVKVVPDFFLSSKDTARSRAESSTPDNLRRGTLELSVRDVFFGEIPSEEQLRAYYVRKHGELRGLDWLRPRRIQNAAGIEWLEDQLQRQRTNPDPHRASELNRLQDNLSRTEERVAAEKRAVLSKREYAVRPEPVDYGLTYDDVHWWGAAGLGGSARVDHGLQYKRGRRWFGILSGWKFFLAIWIVSYSIAFAAVSSNINAVRQFFNVSRPYASSGMTVGGALILGFLVTLYTFVIMNWLVETIHKHRKKHLSSNVSAYQRALELHESYKAAEQEAEQALQRRKRSYWESLDGYQFERETAEVLKRYEFSPRLTPGSGDGGVDIEVTRNGLKGVVQCKAHISCVGPSVVRDLYGVIHHRRAAFGIIVSRGGFTKGAQDFQRGCDEPIYFLDTDALIAMQEGSDVLAKAFAHS